MSSNSFIFPHRPRPSRGIALLLVLLMLVMVVPLCVIAVRASVMSRLHHEQSDRIAVADDLLSEAERVVVTWLTEQSADVVLEPDVTSPSILIGCDSWIDHAEASAGDTPCSLQVQITAHDLDGMVRLSQVTSASPMRLTVPAMILAHIDRVSLVNQLHHGIDGLDTLAALRSAGSPVSRGGSRASLDIFPGIEMTEHDDFDVSFVASSPRVSAAVGAHIAVARGLGPARLNVNTSPLERIETALRLLGRSGIELISEARSSGRRASIGMISAAGRSRGSSIDDRDQVPHLTDVSHAWAFRIDISIDRHRRSWWCVYRHVGAAQPGDGTSLSASPWECVQRLAISD